MSLYAPDRVFVERMKAHNPKLIAWWNQGIDRWQIFEIVRKAAFICRDGDAKYFRMYSAPLHTLTVKDPLDAKDNGSYMPLDERTLWKLHEMDITRLNRYTNPVDELEAIAEQAEAEGEKERDYRLDEVTGPAADAVSRVKLSEWER